MKVLVTGAGGQLGRDIVTLFAEKGVEVKGLTRKEFDVIDEKEVRSVIQRFSPDVIIHAAAYTKVDKAEDEVERAYDVNANGSRHVATAAEEVGAKVCYISTDYVFDGTSQIPYQEYDVPSPLGIYGKSKLAGEELVKTLSTRYFIVRTAWVYGLHGHNFVKTMLKLGQERDELKVVNDQIGSPTYTVDLARFLFDLVQTEKYGIYHASNRGMCSWYDFAKAIFAQAGMDVNVEPIPTIEFPTPANRPAYSVLDDVMLRTNGFQQLPNWEEGLKAFMKEWGELKG